MADDRLEQLSSVEDAETTLRDDMQQGEGTVELSASDIVTVEPVDVPSGMLERVDDFADQTQVMDKSQLEQQAAADSVVEELRTTSQHPSADGLTSEHSVPKELFDKMIPTHEREQRFERDDSGEIIDRGAVTQKLDAIKSGPAEDAEGFKTEKMQAVPTESLPELDRVDDPEQTAVRSADSGEWAEVDEEGFYVFIARTDAEGRVKLPDVIFGDEGPAEGVMVFVRAKNLKG